RGQGQRRRCRLLRPRRRVPLRLPRHLRAHQCRSRTAPEHRHRRRPRLNGAQKDDGMKSDAQLQADVADELFRALRVDDAEVAVTVEKGTVTLRGTVGSMGAKVSAGRASGRVAGVRHVYNELEVRLLSEHQREDAELRGSVLRALARNAIVPEGVDATVKDG